MNKKYDFGIVIGRFQPFHLAHQDLINHALSLSEKVVVILGSARSAPDVKNPFTPAMREEIIRACFPKESERLFFHAVRDYPYNDHVWTAEVQNVVNQIVEDSQLETYFVHPDFEKYVNFARGEERLKYSDKDNFPIFETRLEKDKIIRPSKAQSSAGRAKMMTDELVGRITIDTQNNLLLIQEFVNEHWAKKSGPWLLEPTYRLGKVSFRSNHGNIWTLDLTTENSTPSTDEFEARIRGLLKPSSPQEMELPKIAIVGFFKDRSSYYLNLFPQWNFEEFYCTDKRNLSINATQIREKYFADDNSWQKLVPKTVGNYLNAFQQTDFYPNLKSEFAYLEKYREDTKFVGVPYKPVFITTDAVVVQSGHVLVIRRGFQPGKGLLALPGGFLAPESTMQNSAIRELREETQIKVPSAVLRGSIKNQKAFDYPERSQRGRTVTFAYYIELEPSLKDGLPKVKGGDDAKKAFWLPLSALGEKEDEFFEDHLHIIRYFLGL